MNLIIANELYKTSIYNPKIYLTYYEPKEYRLKIPIH